MPSPLETRAALKLLTATAVRDALSALDQFSGSPETVRAALLEVVPETIAHYSDGSAALAADFYDEERELAAVQSRFTAQPVVIDRTVKIRRSVAWAAEPLFAVPAGVALVQSRLAEVIPINIVRPFRDTVLESRRRDPAAVGWRRVARPGACPFCRMLADRGAVYRSTTAYFASHDDCHCVCQPVFSTNDTGEEIDTIQFIASKRNKTPEQTARIKNYLEAVYGD